MSDQENQASRFARDMAANAEKIFKATQLIANTRDEDVNIGTTPKRLGEAVERGCGPFPVHHRGERRGGAREVVGHKLQGLIVERSLGRVERHGQVCRP